MVCVFLCCDGIVSSCSSDLIFETLVQTGGLVVSTGRLALVCTIYGLRDTSAMSWLLGIGDQGSSWHAFLTILILLQDKDGTLRF